MGANDKTEATYHGYTPTTALYIELNIDVEGKATQTNGTSFYKWLDRVRAEAKAESLREAASEIYRLDGDDAEMYNEDLNATPVTVWLRARANQYKEN